MTERNIAWQRYFTISVSQILAVDAYTLVHYNHIQLIMALKVRFD